MLRLRDTHNARFISPQTPTDCSACATPVHNLLPMQVLSRPSPWPHQHPPSHLLPAQLVVFTRPSGTTSPRPCSRKKTLPPPQTHNSFFFSPTASTTSPPRIILRDEPRTQPRQTTHTHTPRCAAGRSAPLVFQCTRRPAQNHAKPSFCSCLGFFPFVLEFHLVFYKVKGTLHRHSR